MEPMKAAAGAQLPIQHIFGRDAFIAGLWRTLHQNSIRLEAERRIGKTSIRDRRHAGPKRQLRGGNRYASGDAQYPADAGHATHHLQQSGNPGCGDELTLTATASSNLPVSFASTTTGVCTVNGSAVTFATETSASTCTIVASQLGDNATWGAAPSVTQNFTVNPTGQSPNFSLNLSLSTLTIVHGTSGLTQLTVTSSNNFTGSLAVTCSGLPSGYTCSANPNPTSIAEGGTATTTVTVTPSTTAAMVRHDSRPLVPFTALAVALCFLGFRKRTRLQLLMVLALGLTVLGALSACGGTASTTSTKPVTSTATITVSASGLGGASSSVNQSTTLTVIAQ